METEIITSLRLDSNGLIISSLFSVMVQSLCNKSSLYVKIIIQKKIEYCPSQIISTFSRFHIFYSNPCDEYNRRQKKRKKKGENRKTVELPNWVDLI